MPGTEFENKFENLHGHVLHNGQVFNTEELANNDEIMNWLQLALEHADDNSPTGSRTPHDIDILEIEKKRLEQELEQRQQEEAEDKAHRASWQAWANTQRQKINNSLKEEKINKITQLQEALENPKVKDLLLKVRDRTISPEQAFDAIKDNTDLKEKMMSLTHLPLSKRVTDRGGKSRVFRRKNKKTTSTSRRNARRTRRHRKSSTRRSTRK